MSDSFTLSESFHIDDGQLDGLTPVQCFVLGVEWQQITAKLDDITDRPVAFTVHAENQLRLQLACDHRKRPARWTWPTNDSSESWIFLNVMPCDDAEPGETADETS